MQPSWWIGLHITASKHNRQQKEDVALKDATARIETQLSRFQIFLTTEYVTCM
jgi:hypothetical protein